MTEGWYCPRCHKINAPWVPQCSCGDANTNWSPNTGRTTDDPWLRKVTTAVNKAITTIDDGTVAIFNDKSTT